MVAMMPDLPECRTCWNARIAGMPVEQPNPSELLGELLDFRGKVVIVTGASGNVGAGIARRFSQAGADLVLHGNSKKPVLAGGDERTGDASTGATQSEAEKTGAGGQVLGVQADLTSPDGPAQVVEAAMDTFGQIDVLVNNAAIQPIQELAEMSDQDFREMLDVNLTAAHRLTQAVAGQMITGQMMTGQMMTGKQNTSKQASIQKPSTQKPRTQKTSNSIIHIASIEGLQPAPGHSHYAVSKAALIMHARATAVEYGSSGIRVNSVSPGLIFREGINKEWPEGVERWHESAPLGRMGQPEDVADACLFLASPMAAWITGTNLVVDGGITATASF